jgi:hypothetical protein
LREEAPRRRPPSSCSARWREILRHDAAAKSRSPLDAYSAEGAIFDTNTVGCDGRKDVRPCISNRKS